MMIPAIHPPVHPPCADVVPDDEVVFSLVVGDVVGGWVGAIVVAVGNESKSRQLYNHLICCVMKLHNGWKQSLICSSNNKKITVPITNHRETLLLAWYEEHMWYGKLTESCNCKGSLKMVHCIRHVTATHNPNWVVVTRTSHKTREHHSVLVASREVGYYWCSVIRD